MAYIIFQLRAIPAFSFPKFPRRLADENFFIHVCGYR